ncbi:MAG: translation initiation factor IF-2 [Candidatus Zambryskibacteria bacterium RIFCSPLOWO2_12_FULL_39_16]|uniref:Translation initiation factor IF-2 n=1 Tax=Candidatus Zambryskibacteria bacterium RIFCSPLOWO2_12_FULL_39_16 TaxID=1802775 RepID=A0A1G2UU15_9BACT|nr:MAG: translation initiation factor IF-2 [Candidatus Zambryskibacteria bacterium RIFCSPLOWO2_02_FULL_38_13]OHB12875.1 MAG: translation initiation factor IF-2 [Candidatus Zambryskibacteria bacterium RIFCSPLOWO2_12_FULL_39_16]
MKNQKNKTEKASWSARPPVVVIMGHIDHGKSTLLDYIRKTNTTEKEAGSITQHVSAYEVEVEIGNQRRKMTFLDTPGHEAFSSIRARSTKVADIAVLVISAEDGVKPQTIEALGCINKDSTPFIVALNKIDKAKANIDKVKQNLAENGVLVEGWGGNVPIVPISAKTGEGVPDLLEMIALQSDLEDLKSDSSLPAEGFIIESDLNPKQGISATLIIKNGSLKIGQFIASGSAYAPIRSIENYKGENLPEASSSSPVRIVGWNVQPNVGSDFKIFSKKEEALAFISKNIDERVEEKQKDTPSGGATLGVVIKTDTFGSLDAVEHELQKLGNDKITIKIISKGVGSITEKDLKTANIKNSLVLGFNVSSDKSAEMLAMRNNIEIKTYKLIYELVDYVKEKIKEATPVETIEKTTGSATILRIFSKTKDKQVIGGRVEEGEIKSGGTVKILRKNIIIGNGKIRELQTQKIKADIVKEGQEFGMMVESKIELVPKDILTATSLVKQ